MKTVTQNFPLKGNDVFKYSITYRVATPDSSEMGDYEDQGFEVEPTTEELSDVIREAYFNKGIYSPSASGVWESTSPVQDRDFFEKGESKFYDLHIEHPDGTPLTQEEHDFITALLNDGKYSFDEDDNEWYGWGGDAKENYSVGGFVIGALLGTFLGYAVGKGRGYRQAYAGYEGGGEIKNNDRAKVRIKESVKGTQWYSPNEEYEVYRWMGNWALSNDEFNRGIRNIDAIVIETYADGGQVKAVDMYIAKVGNDYEIRRRSNDEVSATGNKDFVASYILKNGWSDMYSGLSNDKLLQMVDEKSKGGKDEPIAIRQSALLYADGGEVSLKPTIKSHIDSLNKEELISMRNQLESELKIDSSQKKINYYKDELAYLNYRIGDDSYADGGEVGKLEKSLSNAENNYRKAIQSEKVGIISTTELNKSKNRVDNARKKLNDWYSSRPISKKSDGGDVNREIKREEFIAIENEHAQLQAHYMDDFDGDHKNPKAIEMNNKIKALEDKMRSFEDYKDGGVVMLGEYDPNIGNTASLENYGSYWHNRIRGNAEDIATIDRLLKKDIDNTEEALNKAQELRDIKAKLSAENLHIKDNFGGSDGYDAWVENYDESMELPFKDGGEVKVDVFFDENGKPKGVWKQGMGRGGKKKTISVPKSDWSDGKITADTVSKYMDVHQDGGGVGEELIVLNSSWFDTNKYDSAKMIKALKSIGAKNIYSEQDRGWSNQPEVVVFSGVSKSKAEDKLNEVFDTQWISVGQKDWSKGGSTYAGGGVPRRIEVVGKDQRGVFTKHWSDYEGMTEQEVIKWWEDRDFKESKVKSEYKLKPYTFYLNVFKDGGSTYADGGSTDESYSFDQLSSEAQEKAIESIRSSYYEHNDFSEFITDDDYLFEPKHAELVAIFGDKYTGGTPILGNSREKLYFSLDRDRHLDASNAIEVNDEDAFLQWLGIPVELQEHIYWTITNTSGRSPDTIIEFELDTEDEDKEDFTSEEEEILSDATDKFADHMSDVLSNLEENYDYRFTDEAIKEDIEANEREFTKDGESYYVKGGSTYSDGGEVSEIFINESPYYIRKDRDTTHFFMGNDKEFVKSQWATAHHIGQHKSESFYQDIRSWLKGGDSPQGKKYTSEYYKDGGSVTTNEGVVERFLTSNDEVNTKNLSTHYSTMGNVVLLRNYGTLIAKRKGKKVSISSEKYSQTTSTIQNMVERLAKAKGLKVERIPQDSFEDGGDTDAISQAKTKGKQSQNFLADAIESVGGQERWNTLSAREKEEVISDEMRAWDGMHSYEDGGELSLHQSPYRGKGSPMPYYVVSPDGRFLKEKYHRSNGNNFAENTMFAISFLDKQDALDYISKYGDEITSIGGETIYEVEIGFKGLKGEDKVVGKFPVTHKTLSELQEQMYMMYYDVYRETNATPKTYIEVTKAIQNSKGGKQLFADGGELKNWNLMVRKTDNSPWEFVNDKSMTESEAVEALHTYDNDHSDYHALEVHPELGFARGGDTDAVMDLITLDQRRQIRKDWNSQYDRTNPKSIRDWDKYLQTKAVALAKEDSTYSGTVSQKYFVDSLDIVKGKGRYGDIYAIREKDSSKTYVTGNKERISKNLSARGFDDKTVHEYMEASTTDESYQFPEFMKTGGTADSKRYKVTFENNRWYKSVYNTPRDQKTLEVELYEGMPLTYAIGADMYSKEIKEIIETKNGTVKEVIVGSEGSGKSEHFSRLKYNAKKMQFKEIGSPYGFYYFGSGEDKRDMSREDGGSVYSDGGELTNWQNAAIKILKEEDGFGEIERTDNRGEYLEIVTDEGEFIVFESESKAENFAVERVATDLEENPEFFNQDWLLDHIDKDKAESFFRAVYEEWDTGYAEDIMTESSDTNENRLVEEMVERGIMSDQDGDADDAAEIAESRIDLFVESMVNDKIEEGNGGFDHYKSNFGEEEANKLIVKENLIDADEASADAVATDGVGHFLSTYDGEQIDLGKAVGFRTN